MKIVLFLRYIKELQKDAVNQGVQTCRDPE